MSAVYSNHQHSLNSEPKHEAITLWISEVTLLTSVSGRLRVNSNEIRPCDTSGLDRALLLPLSLPPPKYPWISYLFDTLLPRFAGEIYLGFTSQSRLHLELGRGPTALASIQTDRQTDRPTVSQVAAARACAGHSFSRSRHTLPTATNSFGIYYYGLSEYAVKSIV
ncbi:hypothetical protein J6590_055725 [Homalodisca vitripennis]|nr:hypothetical protein J6590_055725 [Homalodisca vitripennis]